MRAFIGFFVPEEIVEYAQKLEVELEKLTMKCKMVEPENAHVCLSFLGEIDESRAEEVKSVLSEIVVKSPPKLKTGNIGIVPNERHIRVIVINVLDPTGGLSKITDLLKRVDGGSMHPPHITLCRVKRVDDKDRVVSAIKGMKAAELEFNLKSLCLIKSELTDKGPIYKVVHETKLGSR